MFYKVVWAGFESSKTFSTKEAATEYAEGLNKLRGCNMHYDVYQCVNIHRYQVA